MNFKPLKYIIPLALAFLLQVSGVFAQCAVYGCTDGAVSFGYAWRGKEDLDSYSMYDAKRDAKNSCETNGCKSCTFRYSSESYGWYALLYYFNKSAKKLVHAVGYSPLSEMDAKRIAQDVFEKQYLKNFNQKAPKDIRIKDTWYVAAKVGDEQHAAGVHNHIAENESKDKLFYKGCEAFDKHDYNNALCY